jgi:small subunit ribosomal protein S4
VAVNDRKVDFPSYLIRQGDRIELRGREEVLKKFQEAREMVKDRLIPAWVEADPKQLKGVCLRLPEKSDLQIPVKEQLIVELYSK